MTPPVDVIAAALDATVEVNGGELESVLTIYRPTGLAVLVMNALREAGYEVVPADAQDNGSPT